MLAHPLTKLLLKFNVTLYFVKYNNSILFFEEQSCQANKVLVDCYNHFNPIACGNHVHLGTKLVGVILIAYFIEN